MQENDLRPLNSILKKKGTCVPVEEIGIVIFKSKHVLNLTYGDDDLKSYDIDLGSGGIGDKEAEGDRKTPEGIFYITDKRIIDPPDDYLGSRWMGISYPNTDHAARGLKNGLIDKETYDAIVGAIKSGATPPFSSKLGGDIGIHGGSSDEFGRDWTWGCIGLKNSDIEDFYDYICIGAAVIIQR